MHRIRDRRNRVVVTGIGWTTPLGWDIESTGNRMLNGESGVGPVPSAGTGKREFSSAIQRAECGFQRAHQFDATKLDGLLHGAISDFSILQYLPAKLRKTARLMSRNVQLAVAGSALAMSDAGLSIDGTEVRDRWGCISGAGILNVEHGDIAPAFQDSTESGDVNGIIRSACRQETPS